MKTNMLRTSRAVLVLGAVILALEGCDCPECPECPPVSPEESTTTMKIAGSEYPSVCGAELGCMKTGFNDHFLPATTQLPADLDGRMRWITRAKLTELVDDADSTTTGLKLHYGAIRSGNRITLQLALELVRLTPRGGGIFYDVAPTNSKLYPINDAGGFEAPLTEAKWKGATISGFEGAGYTYLQNVLVYRTNSAITTSTTDRLQSDYDHQSYTFLWQTVGRLIRHNAGTNRVNIYSVGSPAVRNAPDLEDDWKHHVAMVAANDGTELINNSSRSDVRPLMNKALDLGSPCPPSCPIARFYRYGLEPFSHCTCP
jgi:hypothetical protein